MEKQWIIVTATEDGARLELYERQKDGHWLRRVNAPAAIGKNGIGKEREGDGKTPQGVFRLLFAFGTKDKPDTNFPYLQMDASYYWVDDSRSRYYNQLVSVGVVRQDWESAEHIVEKGASYHYVLALDYNADCIPGKGSAIFLHCMPSEGAGCIAVEEVVMRKLLKFIQPGCRIRITESAENRGYLM
ncbi:MAG: L,D-transpeptidase family protein [Lachnospiraceae bacterium]|nr:L,D-transpeptidase family protein [Lachnospiraceae bacterium]